MLLLAAGWLLYFGIHSLLASLRVKSWVARKWPGFMPFYRLAFNLTAGLLILPVAWLTLATEAPWIWQWRGAAGWMANGAAGLALAGFLLTLRDYDGGEFLGLRQWRRGTCQVEDQERFHLSPLHRHVRHPWYSLALVIIWTRDMTLPYLITAAAATAYFVIGSRLEERKLIRYHGEVYREYMCRVPGLIPLPRRRLDRQAAEALLARAAAEKPPNP